MTKSTRTVETIRVRKVVPFFGAPYAKRETYRRKH